MRLDDIHAVCQQIERQALERQRRREGVDQDGGGAGGVASLYRELQNFQASAPKILLIDDVQARPRVNTDFI